jgi:UDP-N-acetyl-D-mannosaminuronic acid dehydrogenase
VCAESPDLLSPLRPQGLRDNDRARGRNGQAHRERVPRRHELSLIADTMGVDVWEVIRLANRHPRVSILQPGPGVGGHCIAVDPWFLVHAAPDQTPLIRTAREVNDGKTDHVTAQVAALVEALPGTKVACLGLAFKANIDDFRESPALKVAEVVARQFGDRVRTSSLMRRCCPPCCGTPTQH